MALPAKSREIAVDFVTETFVRPMMGFQRVTLHSGVGAQAALESCRFEFTQSDRVKAPSGARHILGVVHQVQSGRKLG